MLIFHNAPVVIAVVIVGAVLAYLAYLAHRRWKDRRVDLRSELLKELESLRAVIEALPAQLDSAKRSRTAAAEAGLLNSEAMQQWLGELDIDLLEVKLLESQLPATDTEYTGLSDMELDVRLLEIFGLSLRADSLADKYGVSDAFESDAIVAQVTAERVVHERLVETELRQSELGLDGMTVGAGKPAPHAAFSLVAER
jgi:hypothetical protein